MARGEAQKERRTGGIHQGAPEKISIDERENINLSTRFKERYQFIYSELNLSSRRWEEEAQNERRRRNTSREDINSYSEKSI